jgi:hypothetical protein
MSGRSRVALLALVVVLSACGNSDDTGDGPSKAALACRGEWKDLGKQVEGRDRETNPSALAPRWNTIVAAIDYYASSATGKACDETIAQQKEAISALSAFTTKLAPYDMELRLEQVREDAEAYAAGPTPTPSPTPSPKNKDKKKTKKQKAKPPPGPPAPPTIGNAVKTLLAQAPVATEQQGPGWQQAQVVELTDDAAVAKAVRDLAFLSTQSPAWRVCTTALAQIKLALAATP